MADPFHRNQAFVEMLPTAAGRRALTSFFLSGLLLSFLGAILPAWGYHLRSDFAVVGHYFLCLAVGILVSVKLGQRLLATRSSLWVKILASAIACGALLFLALFPPPASAWWRGLGLLFLGLGAGLLTSAAFHAIWPFYDRDSAATVNLAGILFGMGCLVTSLLVAGTFYIYTVPSILIWLAIIPGFYAGIYAKSRGSAPRPPRVSTIPEALQGFKSPSAVLFSLLLFFQFGNEWSIAGWLPLFLIQRLGISPATSLLLLALYWLALLVGRVAAQALLSRMSHGRLLMASVLAALFGCIVLISTNNAFGAASGILFVGGGFAAIYPLVVEMIGDRFPNFHPGLYNGIFLFAFFGGLLAPATLGYVADMWDLTVVMILPLLGTCMVFLLLLLIWLEAKLSGTVRAKAKAKGA